MSDSLPPHEMQHTTLPCLFTISRSLLKLISTESVMLYNQLIFCCPLLLLPSVFPSIRVFSNELACLIRWPKYWCFSFSISLSNEYSVLISFRIDWLDLPAIQGTLKGLLPHCSSKASVLWCSAFFIVQFSHLNMTTGKTIALTLQTFVGKVMSLFFNHSVMSDSLRSHGNTSASVVPMNIQDWFPLGLTNFISLQSKELSRVFSNTTVEKCQFFTFSPLYSPTLTSIHDYWKNHSLD